MENVCGNLGALPNPPCLSIGSFHQVFKNQDRHLSSVKMASLSAIGSPNAFDFSKCAVRLSACATLPRCCLSVNAWLNAVQHIGPGGTVMRFLGWKISASIKGLCILASEKHSGASRRCPSLPVRHPCKYDQDRAALRGQF